MLKRVPFQKYVTTVDVRPMRFRSIVVLESSRKSETDTIGSDLEKMFFSPGEFFVSEFEI